MDQTWQPKQSIRIDRSDLATQAAWEVERGQGTKHPLLRLPSALTRASLYSTHQSHNSAHSNTGTLSQSGCCSPIIVSQSQLTRNLKTTKSSYFKGKAFEEQQCSLPWTINRVIERRVGHVCRDSIPLMLRTSTPH